MAQQETKQLNQIVVGADERSLYRLLRFLASHELFRKTVNGAFDHTPFSSVLRSDAGYAVRLGACGGTRTPAGEWAHRPLPGDRGQFL
jgi:hypothetical protein